MSELVTIFQDTMARIQAEPELTQAVEASIAAQRLYPETSPIPVCAPRFDAPCDILVSGKKSFEAARAYAGQQVCVLNLASSVSPGGGVLKGARAQEEDLCRVSTLYPCLDHDSVRLPFHEAHMAALRKDQMDWRYNDDIILTPGVTVIKSDDAPPQLLAKDERFTVSVVTCAAPNLHWYEEETLDTQLLTEIFIQRTRRILAAAAASGAEVLILGAFGCGAFMNPPEVVAPAMKAALEEFRHHFRRVEFAVWCGRSTRNRDVFRDVMEGAAE